jgi:hypothetical protein
VATTTATNRPATIETAVETIPAVVALDPFFDVLFALALRADQGAPPMNLVA